MCRTLSRAARPTPPLLRARGWSTACCRRARRGPPRRWGPGQSASAGRPLVVQADRDTHACPTLNRRTSNRHPTDAAVQLEDAELQFTVDGVDWVDRLLYARRIAKDILLHPSHSKIGMRGNGPFTVEEVGMRGGGLGGVYMESSVRDGGPLHDRDAREGWPCTGSMMRETSLRWLRRVCPTR